MEKIAEIKLKYFVYASSFFGLLKDKAVLYGISNKIWVFFSSLITAPLIIIYFSPSLQGFYFTFSSLLGIQSLFVMGLGQLLQQFVSHEWAKITYNEKIGLTGDTVALERLASIKQFTLRWFFVLSIAMFIGLSIGGIIFLKNSPSNSLIRISEWIIPWITICFLKSFQILISPGLTFLEGINQVESVNRFRFAQSISERITAWIILLIGGKLWLFSAGTGVNILGQIRYFRSKYFGLLKNIVKLKPSGGFSWKNEILPLQWRYAISSFSGYLNFSFIVPLVFWSLGPVIAGQTGITWAIITMFWGLSVTIITTKMPELAIESANKNFNKVNRTFFVSTLNSLILLSFTVVLFYVSLLLLQNYFPNISSRFLNPFSSFILSLSIIPHHLRFAMISYMRALKKEPFWHLSFMESILILILLPIACNYFGVNGLAITFLLIISFSTAFTYFIFNRIRKQN